MAKNISLILTVLLLLFHSSAWAGTSVDYNDANCQFAWLMDIDENPLTDSSGNGITGALASAGNPDYTASGKFNGGYIYDGDDFVYHSLTPPNGAFTMVAWQAYTGSSDEIVLTFRSLGTPGTYDRALYIDGTDFIFSVYNGGAWRLATSTTNVPVSGTWVHLAGTIDTTNGNSIWVNGVNENTNANGTNGYNTYADPIILSGASTGVLNPYNGTQDELSTFSRLLNSTEINDIMDNGLAPAAVAAVIQPIINIF